MVQDPLVGEQFSPRMMNLLSQTFQNLEIKLLVDSLARWNRLSMHYPFAAKEANQHEPRDVPYVLCCFFWGVTLKTPTFMSVDVCSAIPTLNKNFTLILCSKYLLPIFMMSCSNTT